MKAPEIKKKIDEFFESRDYLRLSSNTQQSYYQALVFHYLAFIVEYQIEDLDLTVRRRWVIDNYIQYMRKKKISGKSIQLYLIILKIFYRWMSVPLQYTYRLDSEELKSHAAKRKGRWFTESDIEKCLNYFNTDREVRNNIMVRLLVETGVRLNELANVRNMDVSVPERMIQIKVTKTMPRVVFFSPETQKLIIRYYDTHRTKKSDLLFSSRYNIKKLTKKMLDDLGLKTGRDGRGPHTFRHYCATWLFYVGSMQLMDIARLLGDTPEMIEKCYLHPTPDILRRKIDKAMAWDESK